MINAAILSPTTLVDAALKCLVRERGRWVLWLPVLFGIGIGFYFSLPVEPPLWLGPLGVVAEDCWRADGVAVWLGGPGRIRIETVNGVRGRRPWGVRPVARKKKSAPGT